MEVLLVNPPSGYLAEPDALPPLGLLYLGTALRDVGYEVKVLDMNLQSVDLKGHNPFLIGITCVTPNYVVVKKLIVDLRGIYPRVPVVVGGPHVSAVPSDGVDLGADFTCTGDGEYVIQRLARSVLGGQMRFGGRDALPRTFHGFVSNINSYPIPARDLVPIHSYRRRFSGVSMTSVMTQRGCPYECSFCCRYDGDRHIRVRGVDNVVEEVDSLSREGFGAISFHDDEINVLRHRILDLCSYLMGRGLSFKANVRADLLTYELAEAMSKAGFKQLCVGVESGNAEILRNVRKGTTPEINRRCRRICSEFGISFKAFVMVGLPGESLETIEDTKRWLMDNHVDDLTVSLFIPYPGTHVYKFPEEYDIGFDFDYRNLPLPHKGGPDLIFPPVTWTSHIDREVLARIPNTLESEVRKELGI